MYSPAETASVSPSGDQTIASTSSHGANWNWPASLSEAAFSGVMGREAGVGIGEDKVGVEAKVVLLLSCDSVGVKVRVADQVGVTSVGGCLEGSGCE